MTHPYQYIDMRVLNRLFYKPSQEDDEFRSLVESGAKTNEERVKGMLKLIAGKENIQMVVIIKKS